MHFYFLSRKFKFSFPGFLFYIDKKKLNLIYELSFKEAINSKPPIISDYKIITFGITTPEIEKIAEDNKYLEVKKDLKDITARELATAIALRKAIKKLKIKNAISFHRSIKRAETFRKQQDLISKIYPKINHGKLLNRGNEVIELLDSLHCLKITKEGHPSHPLYLPSKLKPISFK